MPNIWARPELWGKCPHCGKALYLQPAVKAYTERKHVRQRLPEHVKAMTWKRVDTIARAWEPRFEHEAAAQLERDRRAVLAAVAAARKTAKARKASIDWVLLSGNIDAALAAMPENWRAAFIPLLQGVMTAQGLKWSAQFGMQFDVHNFFAEQWFSNYTLRFAQQPCATTERMVHQILEQGLHEGWGADKTAKYMGQVFDQWIAGNFSPADFEWLQERTPYRRTEMLARTETIRASNAGSQALFVDWGVQYHEWYATPDSRTREAHQVGSAFGHEPLVVPISEPFRIGGELLMYPGDPSGSPENVINCRCVVLPVIPDETEQEA